MHSAFHAFPRKDAAACWELVLGLPASGSVSGKVLLAPGGPGIKNLLVVSPWGLYSPEFHVLWSVNWTSKASKPIIPSKFTK